MPGVRRAAGRPGVAARGLPGAGRPGRHGQRHRLLAAVPGRRRRPVAVEPGSAARRRHARPRPPRL